jgi:3-oxoacyl-[acyl-carrier-protein] synthase III
MFILATSEYLPARVVDNAYFGKILDKPAAWFVERTGIRERRRCGPGESLHTMAIAAVADLKARDASLAGVELVIGASYTPLDTIGTLAHVIQREYQLQGARAIYLSTACSSFMDALDVAAMYFKGAGVRKALIVAAEHNSAYSQDDDPASGHLWGDGASAVLLAAAADGAQFEVVRIETQGLADRGHGPDAVSLKNGTGLRMPFGREVFARACEEMAHAVRNILAAEGLGCDDIRLLVAHQANKRILDRVADDLKIPGGQVAVTIDSLGNTGCASVAITLHRFAYQVLPGEFIVLVTFGGGYSVGAALLRRTGATRK